ncbi:hypothetical protein [Arthrobacter sp. N199823]|uniref:hypothetical protein n=1 Tax=Arthrobacter sp. N199823 TaxID=2058895 RepID=UPI0011B06F33|nr:hypothetical protein [Arthrobacter sp. N199823]
MTETALINTSPRPRILVLGSPHLASLVDQIKAFAPTVSHTYGIHNVRQAEWDLVVTDRPYMDVSTDLCVIYIAPDSDNPQTLDWRSPWKSEVRSRHGSVSQELQRVNSLPERIGRLTHEHLEPIFRTRTDHTYFALWSAAHRFIPANAEPGPDIDPFILSGDNQVLAGRYKRSTTSEAWLLPSDISDPIPWIKGAIAEWHEINPSRFPGNPSWSQNPDWMNSAEQRIHREIDNAKAKFAVVRRDHIEVVRDLESALQAAAEEADNYERALLTSQSETLKNAVARCLSEIGFIVEDRDQIADPGDDLEDLRVTDPEAPGWVALVEVKGYSKGATTAAISQFIRFNNRYVLANGKPPSANWYVVNQFMNRDPSERQPVLNGKDEDVRAFAEGNSGLVVDTTQLFGLLSKVASDSLTAVEARASLRLSTGRFINQPE